MKKHIRKYYEKLYRGEMGAKVRELGGKPLAVELGYPLGLIDRLPGEIWADFLSCGNVLPCLHPEPGDRVLNLGCGAGVDSIALRLSFGEKPAIVNLDATFLALIKACTLTRRFFPGARFEYVCADGGSLPFMSACFQWVILNGVFNLFPEKGELIAELSRVLKSGGVVAGADLIRTSALPDYFASEPDAWAWCMSGALSQDELSAAFEAGGFTRLDLVAETIDECFSRAIFSFRKTGRRESP